MPAITVDGLAKSYGDFDAVKGVSFTVEDGEILGILGANGAGKTTTIECIQGLRPMDGGSITVLGLDPQNEVRLLRDRIGSQLQDSALPDRIKVWEALDLFASADSGQRQREVMLEEWGLANRRNARFASLSGGEKQRLFVSLALINSPELVFLDEMTTGLDPSARRVAWDLIRRIRERGRTVVLVTHFMDEAESLCDRLLVFSGGEVVAEGSPQGLIEEYGGGIRVRFEAPSDDLGWLGKVRFVESVAVDRNQYTITGQGPVVAHVAAELASRGIVPPDLRTERATLEEVFLNLTERSIRS
jgi:ABC-2 type transport system ATP-binding protein